MAGDGVRLLGRVFGVCGRILENKCFSGNDTTYCNNNRGPELGFGTWRTGSLLLEVSPYLFCYNA